MTRRTFLDLEKRMNHKVALHGAHDILMYHHLELESSMRRPLLEPKIKMQAEKAQTQTSNV